jgi:microcystin-dependent protein
MSQMVTADRLDFQRATESEPLSDHDVQMVHRYLSDPTVFPREFKRWITEHSSDTVDIAKTQVHGLVNNTGQVVIGGASMKVLGATCVGVLWPYAAVVAPEGWLLCDGREIDRVQFATLFALLGTTWGAPTTGAVFKLPDLRGRSPYGVDGNVAFAGSDGRPAGTRGPSHHHHFIDTKGFSASGYNTLYGNTSWNGDHNHGYRRHTEAGISIQQGTQGGYATVGGTGGFDDGTGGYGGHNHDVSVGAVINVTGQVSIDADTTGGGAQDTPGWVGINWIIGSGVAP